MHYNPVCWRCLAYMARMPDFYVAQSVAMRLPLPLFCCILLYAGLVGAQTQQQATKFLNELPAKIHEGKATDADMAAARTLYDNTNDETVKRRILVNAAQYQRLFNKNPKRSLETLMPQLLNKDDLRKWRERKEVEPPRSVLLNICDENVMFLLEVAQSLAALDKTELALEFVDEIGKRYTDETRAFAAGAAGDIYNNLGDFAMAVESYKLASSVFQQIGRRDFYYNKSNVGHVREEINALRKWVTGKQKEAEKEVATSEKASVQLDFKGWKPAQPNGLIQRRLRICWYIGRVTSSDFTADASHKIDIIPAITPVINPRAC